MSSMSSMFEYGVQRVPSRAKGLLLNWSHTDRPSLRIKLRRPFCDSGARHDEMTLRTVGKLVTLCVFVASNPWTEPNSRNQGTCKFSHPKLRTVTKQGRTGAAILKRFEKGQHVILKYVFQINSLFDSCV